MPRGYDLYTIDTTILGNTSKSIKKSALNIKISAVRTPATAERTPLPYGMRSLGYPRLDMRGTTQGGPSSGVAKTLCGGAPQHELRAAGVPPQ